MVLVSAVFQVDLQNDLGDSELPYLGMGNSICLVQLTCLNKPMGFVFQIPLEIHPWSLIWNLNISPLEKKIPFGNCHFQCMFSFHVKLWGIKFAENGSSASPNSGLLACWWSNAPLLCSSKRSKATWKSHQRRPGIPNSSTPPVAWSGPLCVCVCFPILIWMGHMTVLPIPICAKCFFVTTTTTVQHVGGVLLWMCHSPSNHYWQSLHTFNIYSYTFFFNVSYGTVTHQTRQIQVQSPKLT